MFKFIVHTEKIERILHKKYFQIKLPSNSKKIVGLLVIVTQKDYYHFTPQYTAGYLNLWTPQKRNLFFSDVVQLPQGKRLELPQDDKPKANFDPMKRVINYYDQITFIPTFIPIPQKVTQKFWYNGTRNEFLSIDIPVSSPIIEGLFESLVYMEEVPFEITINLKIEI